jgi:putative ABC transport system permease protein
MGAKRWHITLQFLVETVVLTACGGGFGLAVGLAIPPIATRLSHVQTVVTPGSLVLSLAVSIGIGVVFGIYPARKAAFMDPIEALRHE